MSSVSEAFLLTTAQIAATLIGLFLVGMFFYVQTGFRHLAHWGPGAQPFFRSTSKLILQGYALVLGLSLVLVAFGEIWAAVLLVAMSLAIIVSLVQTTIAAGRLPDPVRRSHGQVWFAWPPILFTLALPWALARGVPGVQELTWTMFLAGAVAFVLTVSLLLFAVELSRPADQPGEPLRDAA